MARKPIHNNGRGMPSFSNLLLAIRLHWKSAMALNQKPAIITRPECQWFLAGKCLLGLYGGDPQAISCALCVSNRENTEEFAASLTALRERSHPAASPRVSGCCDSALNPVLTNPAG